MNVVILGMGTVGRSITELLAQHGHDVTVVDNDAAVIRQVEESLDVRAVLGSAADASLLFQVGVQAAHLCLAVTNVDEINLVAASVAKAMGAQRSIARVFSPAYREYSTFDYQRHFGIDRLLSLEHLTALELATVIRNPGSVAVENFARGLIEMQEIVVEPEAKAVGVALRDMHFPPGVRVGSITHGSQTAVAGPDDEVEAGDSVTLIGTRGDVDRVKRHFEHRTPSRQHVVIAGGGEIGYSLARILEGRRHSVTIVETDAQRCEVLANRLEGATILSGDATQLSLLEEERVGSADVFVATMGDDEDNIMAAVEAHELGTAKSMAVIRRPDYARVIEKLGIDHTVSPRLVMARQVLSYLTEGPVLSRTSFSGTDVLELEVQPGAPATRHTLRDLPLPKQALVAAIMREDYVRVPGADDGFSAGDMVVLLVQKDSMRDAVVVFASET
jgi:trk system potassium uptake protein TrkA